MKPEELMIGDWVQNPLGLKGRVRNIKYIPKANTDNYGGYYLLELVFGEGAQTFSINEARPIPITPEILEKNGFDKLDFSHYHIKDRTLVLDADGKWKGPLSWHWVVTEMDTNAKGQPVVIDYYVATINYVHELQHALRLCGIEKEIIL